MSTVLNPEQTTVDPDMKRKLNIEADLPSTNPSTSVDPHDPFSMTGGSPISVLGDGESLAAAASGGKLMRQGSQEHSATVPIRRSSSIIDELLSDSMGSFHSEGALVAPSRCANMEDILMECCDSRGFTYGIYWALDDNKQLLVARDRYSLPTLMAAGSPTTPRRSCSDSSHVFCETSAMLSAFPVGLGMPGRVAITKEHEWRSGDIGCPGKAKIFRQDLALSNSIKTIIGVAVPGGVLELGSTEVMEESLSAVRHIRTMCQNYTG